MGKNRHRNQPVACIEDSCQGKGVLCYNGSKVCSRCGGEMFPIDQRTQVSDELLDFDFSQDMFERMRQYETAQPIVVQHSDTFRCSPDLKGCPIAQKAKVYVQLSMFNKWIFLANQLKTEWIAYLKGHPYKDQPNTYEITEMYFPKQKGSAAHCEADEGEIEEGVIAAVHSHVGMNVFFSGEDEAHFNHNVELVVNNKGEILATGRTQLECGRWHRGPADIVFLGCDEEVALQEALESKLSPETTRFVVQGQSPMQFKLPQ